MPELAALLAELTCGDDERAESAALQLAGYGESAFQALRNLLRDEDVDARWWAIRALAQFETLEKVNFELVAALQDGSSDVRQCAAMALCHHPHPGAVSPLNRALSDPDTMTASLARNALIQIGAGAVPELIETLRAGSRAAKLEALRALAEIKDPRAIPPLMQALDQDSALMQYWAEHGLDKLGLGMVYLKPE
ncbi:MAG: HEAT repeat domain-containing protein [Chloroflexi bacterium]|nr:MAG: HEAT repeat domain-containing protein [Chloroflexota bacterium]